MAITKTGHSLSKTAAPAQGSLLRDTTRWGLTHPLAAGVTALGVASGDMSVGESVGMGVAGAGGYFGTQRALQQIPSRAPRFAGKAARAARFLPGWMKPVGMFAAGMAGGFSGGEVGRRIGSNVPIWQRDTPQVQQPDTPQVQQPEQYY